MYKRIYDSEEIVVDYYNDGKPMIRVSQFKDYHWQDEHFVEIPVEETQIEKIEPGEVKLDAQCCRCGIAMGSQDNYCPNCGAKVVARPDQRWRGM